MALRYSGGAAAAGAWVCTLRLPNVPVEQVRAALTKLAEDGHPVAAMVHGDPCPEPKHPAARCVPRAENEEGEMENGERQKRIARIIRLIKAGHANSAEADIQKEVARIRIDAARIGGPQMDSIKAKALRLLQLSDNVRPQGLLEEAHTDTTATGDAIFQLIGNTADYDRLAGIIRACEDYKNSYTEVLNGLNDEIKIVALKYLGGEAS